MNDLIYHHQCCCYHPRLWLGLSFLFCVVYLHLIHVANTGNDVIDVVIISGNNDDLHHHRPYSLSSSSSNDLTILRNDDDNKLQQQQQQQQQQQRHDDNGDGDGHYDDDDDDDLILLQKVKELLFLHHHPSPSSSVVVHDNDTTITTIIENNNNNNKLFQFYVYDNLTEPYRPETISNCLERYGKRNSNFTTMKEFYKVHCDWSTTICKPQTTTKTTTTTTTTTNKNNNNHYNKRRLNSNADAILARQFLNYTGKLRTYNPNEATIFIVPYPAASLKECYRSIPSKSKRLKASITQHERKLFKQQLGIYWNNVPYKHLFLYSAGLDQSYIGEYIQSRHNNMIAMLGPKKRPGHIVIPYANTHPEYQPNILLYNKQQQQQQQRKYGLSAVLSKDISGNGKIRQKFVNNIDNYFPNNRTIIANNGRRYYPIKIIVIDSNQNRNLPNEDDIMDLYRKSIFCPIFRGDSPIQKRFFDVILSGCIPVVMAYYNNNNNNNSSNSSKLKSKSYFADGANGALVEDTYPFATTTTKTKTIINNGNKKIVVDYDIVGIDYTELVVEIQPNGCVECISTILEDLLLNQPNIIKQKQDYINKIRPLFSYGMMTTTTTTTTKEENFLKYPDAVSALLYQAQQYVINYENEK